MIPDYPYRARPEPPQHKEYRDATVPRLNVSRNRICK